MGFNLLVFITSLFYTKAWLLISSSFINILLFSTYLIFTEYFFMFAGISATNKIANKISGALEGMNGQVS